MNSVIDAQEEYFNGKILFMAPGMPNCMLFNTKEKNQDKIKQDYFRRCVDWQSRQQRDIWDQKLKNNDH